MSKEMEDMVAHFTAVFAEPHLPYNVGPYLTCDEVKALTDLLQEAGYTQAATDWWNGHLEGDYHVMFENESVVPT